MEKMLPPDRPRQPEATTRAFLAQAGVDWPVALLVRRGYYARSMGPTSANDRGIYDDAFFIVAHDVHAAYNGNADPSIRRSARPGRQGIATLLPGVHWYRRGNHGISRHGGGYPAFRPATPGERLPVRRDGETNPAPGVAINIHKGARNSTSSEGCLTIPPDQWPAFYATLDLAMRRAGVDKFPVLVVES